EVFGAQGGIQMFCRALCLATGHWAQKHGVIAEAVVLNDRFAPDSRYVNGGFKNYVAAGKRKSSLVSAYLKSVLPGPPDLVVFGHVSLSKLALIPAVRLQKYCVVAYGVEVWRPLSKGEQRAIRNSDAVLAISDYTGSNVIDRSRVGPDKVKLFPCSLDPYWIADGVEPSNEIDKPVILTVCRLTRDDSYKGVDSVIRSLPSVIARIGDVEYRIVGDGDDLQRLKSLANEVGVASHVKFMGELTSEQLREEYRRCSIFVMPSEGEGFGIVFLEAMAGWKAVIGGAHGGTPSVVKHGETGILVERLNVNAISEAISTLLEDHALRTRLGDAGYERLSNVFTFNRFESKLDELFSSMLRESAIG